MVAGSVTSKDVANPRRHAFRADIQGLRAIAVLLVLLYHARVPFLPGGFVGVDVFFVISGYLITGLLLREMREHGRISLADFYARRARRILPAAGLTLVAIVVATFVFLPPMRWQDTFLHVGGAAVYVVNWLLAAMSVDYLASGQAASPVQHYWSLAVEEQFYIIWPVLLIVGAALIRRGSSKSLSVTRVATIALVIIAVPSFVFSIYYTTMSPGAAYFVTTTRLWELGVGAGIAIAAASWEKIPTAAADALTWAGLAAIIAAGVLFTGDTPFPSYTALLPTLGAAAVIVGGTNAGRAGAGALLSLRPMTFVGDISYSLYLWHWPMIAIGTYVLGGLSLSAGLTFAAAAFIPAYLSYRYVELPIMRGPRFRSIPKSLGLGAAITLGTGMVAAAAIFFMPRPEPPPAELPTTVNPVTGEVERVPVGAELVAAGRTRGTPVNSVDGFIPEPAAAADDNAAVYADGCHQDPSSTAPVPCVYGDEDSDFTVAMVGDSHTAHWVPALQILAEEHGWRLETYTKSSCPLNSATVIYQTRPYEACAQWNENVLDHLTGAHRPDVLFSSNSTFYTPIVDGAVLTGEAAQDALSDGLRGSWQRLSAAGISVVSLVDTPRVDINVPECVWGNPTSLTSCAVPRAEALADSGRIEGDAADGVGGVTVIDMNDHICPAESCAPVVGGVVVYRDGNHLTGTYARTLAAPLWERLADLPAFAVEP